MSRHQLIIEREDAIAFHPGYYLNEFVEHGIIKKGDLDNDLKQILRGRAGVTLETALKLGALTKVSTEFWLNLQRAYDEIENDTT